MLKHEKRQKLVIINMYQLVVRVGNLRLTLRFNPMLMRNPQQTCFNSTQSHSRNRLATPKRQQGAANTTVNDGQGQPPPPRKSLILEDLPMLMLQLDMVLYTLDQRESDVDLTASSWNPTPPGFDARIFVKCHYDAAFRDLLLDC